MLNHSQVQRFSSRPKCQTMMERRYDFQQSRTTAEGDTDNGTGRYSSVTINTLYMFVHNPRELGGCVV